MIMKMFIGCTLIMFGKCTLNNGHVWWVYSDNDTVCWVYSDNDNVWYVYSDNDNVW